MRELEAQFDKKFSFIFSSFDLKIFKWYFVPFHLELGVTISIQRFRDKAIGKQKYRRQSKEKSEKKQTLNLILV